MLSKILETSPLDMCCQNQPNAEDGWSPEPALSTVARNKALHHELVTNSDCWAPLPLQNLIAANNADAAPQAGTRPSTEPSTPCAKPQVSTKQAERQLLIHAIQLGQKLATSDWPITLDEAVGGLGLALGSAPDEIVQCVREELEACMMPTDRSDPIDTPYLTTDDCGLDCELVRTEIPKPTVPRPTVGGRVCCTKCAREFAANDAASHKSHMARCMKKKRKVRKRTNQATMAGAAVV